MFKGKFYEHQKEGAHLLVNRRKVLLAHDQGTGKTITSIGSAEKLFQLKKAKKCLVICPSALTFQWEEQILDFTDSPVVTIHKDDKVGREYADVEDYEYWIVSYNLYRRDYKKIHKVKWDIVIYDEANEFKNFKSKTRKLLLALNRSCNPKYRWALTGTPVSNHLEELHSIFYVVDKNFLPPWPTFAERHILFDQFGGVRGYKNLNSIHKLLQERMSRVTHKDLEGKIPKLLPPVIHTIPKDRTYANIEKKLLQALDKEAKNIYIDENGELKGARRSSSAGKAFHAAKIGLATEAKLKYAVDYIEEHSDHKIVLFSHFKEPIYSLERLLDDAGIKHSRFTGDESPEEKRESKQIFAKEGQVLLCSDAGAKGLDLPFADIVLHIDVPFSWEILDQRNKRITRLSSEFSTVVANFLMIEGSLEQFYYKVTNMKGKLAEATLEGTADEVILKQTSLRQFLKHGDKTQGRHTRRRTK